MKCPLEHLLSPTRVAAAEQHLAKPPVDAPIAGGFFPGRDENALGLAQPIVLHVHPRHGDKNVDVPRMSLHRVVADVVYELPAWTMA
jgi:hypothetical protein